MNVPKFSLSNLLTVLGLVGAFAVFLMRYSERISTIENLNVEQEHRIERAEALIRDMYPKLERLDNNVNWLVQHQKKEYGKQP